MVNIPATKKYSGKTYTQAEVGLTKMQLERAKVYWKNEGYNVKTVSVKSGKTVKYIVFIRPEVI